MGEAALKRSEVTKSTGSNGKVVRTAQGRWTAAVRAELARSQRTSIDTFVRAVRATGKPTDTKK